jgi:hypothetical protein
MRTIPSALLAILLSASAAMAIAPPQPAFIPPAPPQRPVPPGGSRTAGTNAAMPPGGPVGGCSDCGGGRPPCWKQLLLYWTYCPLTHGCHCERCDCVYHGAVPLYLYFGRTCQEGCIDRPTMPWCSCGSCKGGCTPGNPH